MLVEAAFIELAQATNRDLFDEAMPLDFSEQAYQRFKRHKVPFSGVLKAVGAGLPKPRSDDAIFLRLKESKRDALTRRFDAVRGKLADRLRDLMEFRRKLEQLGPAGLSDRTVDVRLIGLGYDKP